MSGLIGEMHGKCLAKGLAYIEGSINVADYYYKGVSEPLHSL